MGILLKSYKDPLKLEKRKREREMIIIIKIKNNNININKRNVVLNAQGSHFCNI